MESDSKLSMAGFQEDSMSEDYNESDEEVNHSIEFKIDLFYVQT